MSLLELNPRKTALVVIDLQNAVVGRPIAPHSSAEIVERSARLAKALREKGGTIVYVRVNITDFIQLPVDVPPFGAGSAAPPPSASELLPEAGFQAGDALITKRHWGAFAGTELEQVLKDRDVDTVVLTGIATNVGVESTARQGTGLGFAFVVVEDACGAMDEESHRYSFEKIFPRLARVRTADQVIAALA